MLHLSPLLLTLNSTDRAPEKLFNELELAFNAAKSGVMIGMTDPALPNVASTVRACKSPSDELLIF